MNMPWGKPLAGGLLIVLGTLGLTGCQVYAQRSDAALHQRVYDDDPGDYYYYPEERVYFNIRHGYYWYHDGGHWYRSDRLPRHLVLDHHRRTRIHVDRGEPWRHHDEHQGRFGHHGDGVIYHDGGHEHRDAYHERHQADWAGRWEHRGDQHRDAVRDERHAGGLLRGLREAQRQRLEQAERHGQLRHDRHEARHQEHDGD